MGRPRLRCLDGVEKDLRKLKVKRLRHKENKREEYTFVLKGVKALSGPYSQVTSKYCLTYNSRSEDEMRYIPDG
jgi:hypothetical protein